MAQTDVLRMLAQVQDETSAPFGRMKQASEDLSKAVDDLKKDFDKLSESQEDHQKTAERHNDTLRKQGEHVKEHGEKWTKLREQLHEARETIEKQMDPAIEAMGLKSLTAAASIGGLLETVKTAAESGAAMLNLSRQTDFSVNSLNTWIGSATAFGSTSSSMAGAIKGLSDQLQQMKTLSGGPLFSNLISSGAIGEANQIRSIMNGIGSDADKNSKSLDVIIGLFRRMREEGKSEAYIRNYANQLGIGADFVQATRMSREELKRFLNDLAELRGKPINAESLENYDKAMTRLSTALSGLRNAVTGNLLDDFNKMTNSLATFIGQNKENIGHGIAAGIREISTEVKQVLPDLKTLREIVEIIQKFNAASHGSPAQKAAEYLRQHGGQQVGDALSGGADFLGAGVKQTLDALSGHKVRSTDQIYLDNRFNDAFGSEKPSDEDEGKKELSDKLKNLGVHGYAEGAQSITRSGLAMIHSGETVVPAESSGPFQQSHTEEAKREQRDNTTQLRELNEKLQKMLDNAERDERHGGGSGGSGGFGVPGSGGSGASGSGPAGGSGYGPGAGVGPGGGGVSSAVHSLMGNAGGVGGEDTSATNGSIGKPGGAAVEDSTGKGFSPLSLNKMLQPGGAALEDSTSNDSNPLSLNKMLQQGGEHPGMAAATNRLKQMMTGGASGGGAGAAGITGSGSGSGFAPVQAAQAAQSSGGVGGDLDKGAYEKMFAGTPLAGHADDVIAAAKANNIAPAMMAGIMAHETGKGQSRMLRDRNNPAGLMDPKTGMSTGQNFPDVKSGIDAAGRTMAKNFHRGGDTIEGMARSYAPVGAANDPHGLNSGWAGGVRRFTDQLQAHTPQPPSAAGVASAGREGDAYVGVGDYNFMGSARARAMGMGDVTHGGALAQQKFATGIKSGGPAVITANKYAGPDMAGFLHDLHESGAPLKQFAGAYVNKPLQHGYGNALDIESGFGSGPNNSPALYAWSQAHPKEFAEIQAKHHMRNLDTSSGAHMHDWGHFEWSPSRRASEEEIASAKKSNVPWAAQQQGLKPWPKTADASTDPSLAKQADALRPGQLGAMQDKNLASVMEHTVKGEGHINVHVKAPRGTNVAAKGGGMFNKVKLNRSYANERSPEHATPSETHPR